MAFRGSKLRCLFWGKMERGGGNPITLETGRTVGENENEKLVSCGNGLGGGRWAV